MGSCSDPSQAWAANDLGRHLTDVLRTLFGKLITVLSGTCD
jgi:hypothetical protein